MKSFNKLIYIIIVTICFSTVKAQYSPKHISTQDREKAHIYAEKTYNQLSNDERIGQLFIVAVYTNKGDNFIHQVRNLVKKEHIGGLILMQDDVRKHISLINEFQATAKIPLMIGIDAEWGLYQRFPIAHKFPWAMTLGAIQNPLLVYEMANKIALDCRRVGINWNFAPVVDVNTNPLNPIIGNRSFGSNVENVISKGLAYANGLQDHGILASIKHFPGHGDTDRDSHLDLPIISHSLKRLNQVELAPFKALMDKHIGGVMVAHLYIPALEPQKGIPGSLSHHIITDLLKKQYGYKGLIITDALNMNAVAKKFSPGELDLKAFKAGNDIMLFSQDVPTGKALIKKALASGEITQDRLRESVIKILETKYLLGIQNFKPINPENIEQDLNNESHQILSETLYANAITAIKNETRLLPLKKNETYYYLPLEEASYKPLWEGLQGLNIHLISQNNLNKIPKNSKIIIGVHKDNSTAYKPYKISAKSKNILNSLKKDHQVILIVFGSPYALRDISINNIPTVLVAYENNELAMKATAQALKGFTPITGRLPVIVNTELPEGKGIDINPEKK